MHPALDMADLIHDAAPGGVNRDGRGLLHELEELALRGAGVAEQQHVDVPTQAGLVGQVLRGPAEEEAANRLLDVTDAILLAGEDGRRDRAVQFVTKAGRL